MAPRQKPGEHRNASRFEALSFSDAGALLTANRPLQVAPFFPTLFTYLQLGCFYTDVSTNNTPYGTHASDHTAHSMAFYMWRRNRTRGKRPSIRTLCARGRCGGARTVGRRRARCNGRNSGRGASSEARGRLTPTLVRGLIAPPCRAQ